MSTPGIGDPYWYEWSVGLLYVIEMLNPDSKIDCVILQHSGYDVIDDVVVTYVGGHKRLCIQVKHHISTSQMDNLTFGKMLESSQRASGTIKPCLFKALFDGWKTAKASDSGDLKPVLYTNRLTTGRRSGRHYKTQSYSAYSLNDFIAKIKQAIADSKNGSFSLADNNLRFQLSKCLDFAKMILLS